MLGQSRKYIFIVIQFALYGAFLSLDILEKNTILSNRIKFAVVVLCFFYVIIGKNKKTNREHIFLIYALFFTVISDILILFTDYYLYGVSTFIIAQQFYGMRITELYNRESSVKSKMNLLRDLLIRLLYQGALGVLVSMFLLLMNVNIDALLGVSIFYFISICTNVVRGLKQTLLYRDKRDLKYFAIGMVIFLLCDINVGLFNMSAFLTVGPRYEMIYSVAAILMWTFYAPSQVLISLSGDSY
ncbi:MAG: hypothetical protein EWM47_10180 [Anaerolineaceae bacterium]|nr:MAG: hypothetical protein EWM47_10180 [Anaerolineaceae bacterium]